MAKLLISEVERLFDSVIVLKDGSVAMFEPCDDVRARFGSNLEEAVKQIF